MRNVLKTIALVAMIGLSTAAYAQQKSITVTGMPNTYRGKAGMLAIATAPNSQDYIAFSLGTISGTSTSFPLSDWTTHDPWNGSGKFAFIIIIGDSAQSIADEQYIFAGQTTATTNVSQKNTSVQWSKFVSLTEQAATQPSTQQSSDQKSISIAGIPNRYKGKVAMLAIAPAGSQTYTAYSLGTISGSSTVFPLLDWSSDSSWNGSGNFAFIIIIGDSAQKIANNQYLYTGATAASSSINQATTTMQWSQFVTK